MSTFTVTSWNVNSVRARLDHVLTYLADHEPDVLCLQETKVEDRLFPRVPFEELGYRVALHGGRALAGVASLTRQEPTCVSAGFIDGPADLHPRVLRVRVEGVDIYNLYAPNGTALVSDAFQYKLRWFARLRKQLVDAHRASEAVLLVGDFNVAPGDQDVWDPEASRGRLLCTEAERDALAGLIDYGLTDCYRSLHPAENGFTWFDYRTGGFARNEGMRIDHAYATPSLAGRCLAAEPEAAVRAWESPSDHVPLTVRFKRAAD